MVTSDYVAVTAGVLCKGIHSHTSLIKPSLIELVFPNIKRFSLKFFF